jgi:predicted metal-dependent peptidase
MQVYPTSNQPLDMSRLQDRLSKAHITLMSHPETSLYAGVMVMGKSEFSDIIPTAATDGVNKFYNPQFCAKLSDAQLRFVVLHEALHVALRHLTRHPEYFKDDPWTANMAADYVDNAIIMALKDKQLCEPPPGVVLYKKEYEGWSFGEVYRDLQRNPPPKRKGSGQGQQGQQGEQQQQQQQGSSQEESGTLDHHDLSRVGEMTDDERKEMTKRVEQALQQGGAYAAKLGQKVPRTVTNSLVPQVDWTDVMREFVINQTQGRDDDISLRRLDRRWLSMDIIMPTTVAETVGEIVYAFDTSGSINDKQIAEGAAEIYSMAQAVQPERVRVLWWDTMVHCEQVFTPEHYDDIPKLLKPEGGGGTMVSSVSKHMREAGHRPDCMVVFTDGYVESEIDWDGMPPTLWVVTRKKDFNPPVGRVVAYNND